MADNVADIGVVTFVVVKNMAHEAIIGWDQLYRHGWSYHTEDDTMQWGTTRLPVLDVVTSYEMAAVESGCLNDVPKISICFWRTGVSYQRPIYLK